MKISDQEVSFVFLKSFLKCVCQEEGELVAVQKIYRFANGTYSAKWLATESCCNCEANQSTGDTAQPNLSDPTITPLGFFVYGTFLCIDFSQASRRRIPDLHEKTGFSTEVLFPNNFFERIFWTLDAQISLGE